jgi:predicted thioesterase
VELPLDAAVTMATLESRNHEVNAIRSGLTLFRAGAVGAAVRLRPDDKGVFVAVIDRGQVQQPYVQFRRDGADLARHWCACGIGSDGKLLCKHIVAAVLGVQGGPKDSPVALGLTATATAAVDGTNTAKAVRSGSLEVFATPMLVALMEEAACACLAGKLGPGQTSVGTAIKVSHKAASPKGSTVTATAVLEWVFGARLEFTVSAADGAGTVAEGHHTRVIVDQEDFLAKAARRAARAQLPD